MSLWTAVWGSIILCFRNVFDRWIHGTMFHKALARILYIPSIAKMSARSRWNLNPAKQWYNRIDETVILGALPFRNQTKEVKSCLSWGRGIQHRLFFVWWPYSVIATIYVISVCALRLA